MSRVKLIGGVTITLSLLAGTIWVVWPIWQRQRAEQALSRAKQALQSGDLEGARKLGLQLVGMKRESPDAQLLLARVAMRHGQHEAGLKYLEPLIATEQRRRDVVAVLSEGADALLELGQVEEAEALYVRAMELDRFYSYARTRLVFLWTLEGRWWQALPIRYELLEQGVFEFEDLMFLANPRAVLADPALDRLREAEPDHPYVLLGTARILEKQNQVAEALRAARAAVSRAPEFVAAQAVLGELLINHGGDDQLSQWHAALPAAADEHPDIWATRGLWLHQRGRLSDAAWCFREALRRDPSHQLSTYQMSLAAAGSGHSETARLLQERAKQLNELAMAMDHLNVNPEDRDYLRRAAELTEALGRNWEAWAWRHLLFKLDSGDPRAEAEEQRLRELLGDSPTDNRLPEDCALALDRLDLPEPQFDLPATKADNLAGGDHVVTFSDVAQQVGLRFQYLNYHDPGAEGLFMHEWTGGGVAVLDYDADGWPDLYFAQGSRFPAGDEESAETDRLYRNVGGMFLLDVTEHCGLGRGGYGQGVTAGDYNNDGWPDLFVAQVGENRLLLNNGDGTFADVTRQAGIAGQRWTVSCAIADLDGDGLPDVYEANYLEGPDVYRRKCHVAGRPRACPPTMFPGQPDRLWINQGDGTFVDRSAQFGIAVAAYGKGLGVLIGDFFGNQGRTIYIANDMTPNFLFARPAGSSSETPFVDRAPLAGVAYDRDGQALAGMGIAADDVNGDGRLDLFVTNFHREANTLYLQQPGEYFVDATAEYQLKQISYDYLGFGTQFLDADLDGRPDLVVANGHIDDMRINGAPYKMPTQVFRNRGDRFVLADLQQLGPYFRQDVLGRGLARLDWNRDGKEDFVVTHLDVPAALLQNDSPRAGNFLHVRLRGETLDRDAIGARVVVRCGDKQWVRQLTCGDGYASSNQRQLVFGLGAESQVDQITVHWPSGHLQDYEPVAVNQAVLLREQDTLSYVLATSE